MDYENTQQQKSTSSFFPPCTDKIRCMILNAVYKRPIRTVNMALKFVCKGSSMLDNLPTHSKDWNV